MVMGESARQWLARRQGIPNAHDRWTAAEDAWLARQVREGVSWRQIARLHGRSVDAVQQRARKVATGG